MCDQLFNRVQFFVAPWTVAYQAPPSMGFSRQECWSGLPFPSSRDLLDPGIEPGSPALQADALPSEPSGKPILYWQADSLPSEPPGKPKLTIFKSKLLQQKPKPQNGRMLNVVLS